MHVNGRATVVHCTRVHVDVNRFCERSVWIRFELHNVLPWIIWSQLTKKSSCLLDSLWCLVYFAFCQQCKLSPNWKEYLYYINFLKIYWSRQDFSWHQLLVFSWCHSDMLVEIFSWNDGVSWHFLKLKCVYLTLGINSKVIFETV